MALIDLVIIIFIIGPFINLLSYLGSAFFIRLFGGKAKGIIGNGTPVFRLRNIEVRTWYFYGYEYYFENLKYKSVFAKVLIQLGGIIFKMLLLGTLLFLLQQKIIFLERYTCYVMIVIIIHSIIEIPTHDIFFKNICLEEESKNLKDDFKNAELYISKVDKELIRLKNILSETQADSMKRMYLVYIINKASVLTDLGGFEQSLRTLEDINIEEFSTFQRLNITYYNNLIYSFIFTGRLEEAEKAYNALKAIFNESDLNIHEELSIKDTIATYEFFKGNFEKSQKLFEEIISTQSRNNSVTCLYFLSQIHVQKGNTTEAINLLNNIDMSKVEPYLLEKIKRAKRELNMI